jgi:hypothetical protein
LQLRGDLDVAQESRGADLTVDPVSSGERGLQAVEGRGQVIWGWGPRRR